MINNVLTVNNGYLFFKIGIFLLLSAPIPGAIFLFLSLIISFYNNKNLFFQDKWNQPFIFATIFLLLIVSISSLDFYSNDLPNWNIYLNWIGLANWIPMFISVCGFKPYLNSYSKIRKISILLIIGTIPLFITGILQVFFKIYGPFEYFGGLITSYQKWGSDGLSGLFSNKNYAGTWLIIIWPLTIALFRERLNKNRLNRFYILLFPIFTLSAIFLTNSRNAWLGTFISTLLLSNQTLILILTLIFLFLVILILAATTDLFPIFLNDFAIKIIPNDILSRFTAIYGFSYFANYPRIDIWRNTINFIIERPFLGWGAASFPILYKSINIECCYKNYLRWIAHTHNFPLEIAFNYGILFSIFINSLIFLILFKSYKLIFLLPNKFSKNITKDYFNKSWWVSCLTLYLSQFFDIQYYDLRISIVFWILISGLICRIQYETKECLDK